MIPYTFRRISGNQSRPQTKILDHIHQNLTPTQTEKQAGSVLYLPLLGPTTARIIAESTAVMPYTYRTLPGHYNPPPTKILDRIRQILTRVTVVVAVVVGQLTEI